LKSGAVLPGIIQTRLTSKKIARFAGTFQIVKETNKIGPLSLRQTQG
jgi:hypothetical protein